MRMTAEWAFDSEAMHEGERNNCTKIQLVVQKYRDKTTLAGKTRFRLSLFWFSKPALFAASLVVAQPIRTQQ